MKPAIFAAFPLNQLADPAFWTLMQVTAIDRFKS